MSQLFISHASEDAEQAGTAKDWIAAARPADRIHLSSDRERGPEPGTRWRAWINNTIRSSDLVVVILSPDAFGPWVSAEIGMALLLAKPIVPVTVRPIPVAHPLISHLQMSPLGENPEPFLALLDGRLGPPIGMAPVGWTEPYPGLRPLGEGEQELLFGRAAERDRLLAALDRTASLDRRALFVSGPSGSGKSSLIRAGVLPRLAGLGWRVVGPTQPQLLAHAAPEPTGGDATDELVVVDQAEELLVLDDEDRAQVIDWINRRWEAGASLLVVVRSEYRDVIGRDLPKPIDHYIPYLAREDLRVIIQEPAKLAGAHVDDELVDRLADETGSGIALPLLAYTLRLLWEGRDRETNSLRAGLLDELGGVTGVLHGRADEALRLATGGDPARVEAVLAMLSTLASPTQNPPTRTPVRVDTVSDDDLAALDHFREVGLVAYRRSFALTDQVGTGIRPTGHDLVDVTHEALFGWSPLADAIDRRREENRLRRAITELAEAWEEGGRADATLLLSGERLAFAVANDLGRDDPVLRRFVARSRARDRERRIRRLLIGLVVVAAAVAVAAAIVANIQRNRADDEAARATTQADRAAAAEQVASRQRDEAEAAAVVARSLRQASLANELIADQRDLAMLAAVAAFETDANPETEGALINGLATPVGPVQYYRSPPDLPVDWTSLTPVDATRAVAISTVDAGRRPLIVDLTSGAVSELALPELAGVTIGRFGRRDRPGAISFHGFADGPDEAVAGLIDLDGRSVTLLDHPRPIEITVHAGAGRLVYGDFDGGIYQGSGATIGSELIDGSRTALPTDLAVSPLGDRLVVAALDGIRVLRADGDGWITAQELTRSPVRPAELVAFAERPASSPTLYAAGSDSQIRRWTAEGEAFGEAQDLGTHPGPVVALTVSTDASTVLTGGQDGSVRRWATTGAGEMGLPVRAHRSPIGAIHAIDDGIILSAAASGAVRSDLLPHRVVEAAGVVPVDWRSQSFRALVEGDGPLAAVTITDRVLVADGRELPAPDNVWRAWWVGESIVHEQRPGGAGPRNRELIQVTAGVESAVDARLDAIDVEGCQATVAKEGNVLHHDLGGCDPLPSPFELGRGDGGPTDVAALDLGDDRRSLAVVYGDGLVEVRAIDGGAVQGSARLVDGVRPTATALLADGRVAVGRDAGTPVEIIDLDATDVGRSTVLDIHTDAVHWLVSDGAAIRLLTAGEDGLINQIDLVTGTVVGRPLVGAASTELNDVTAMVRGLRRLDGGTMVAIHGLRIEAWQLDPAELSALACRRAGRRLDPGELGRLGIDAERAPCS